jgi:polysaccharide biosynthesis protein PslE
MSTTSPLGQPQNVLEVLARHKKAIVLWPLLCVTLGGLYFVFSPRTYRSEARLFLRVGRENVGIDPAATAGQTMQLYTSDRKDEVKSAVEIFRSRNVAAQIVDTLGVDVILGGGADGAAPKASIADRLKMPVDWVMGVISDLDPISDRERAIIKVEKGLNVEGERQATVIVVQYKAKSPQLAQKVCDTAVDMILKEHMRVHRNEESAPFFTEQQERLRQQLDQSLEALRLAKNELGLANVDQRRETLERQYSAIELERLTTSQQLATAEASIADLRKQLELIPEREIAAKRSIPNQGADMLRDRLYELQMKSMDLEARYSESHPLVAAANEQLEEAKKVLANQSAQRTETNDEINPIHRELLLAMKREQSTAAGLTARKAALGEQKVAVLAEIADLNKHDIEIDQLSLEANLARSKYMQYAATMEEARIDRELQSGGISNISVAQPATFAEKPINPAKAMTAAGIFLLAVGGTVALILFGERINLPVGPEPYRNGEVRYERRRKREYEGKANGHAEQLSASIQVAK